MSEWQHALDQFLRNTAAGETSSVSIEVRPNFDYLNLRGDPSVDAFVGAASKILRVDMPLAPNTFSKGISTVYWLGPDEWLIVSPAGERPTLPTLLEDAIDGMHASLNAVTGGYIGLRLSGKNAAAVLAKGCTLDLHSKIFRQGHCAQTGLSRASILISRLDEQPVFDVIVRRSIAEYVALWLQRAGAEFGIRFI